MPWLFHSKVASSSEGSASSPKPFFPIRNSITGLHPRESISSASNPKGYLAGSPTTFFSTNNSSSLHQQHQQHQLPETRSLSPAPPNYLAPRASLTLPPNLSNGGASSPSTPASFGSAGDSPTAVGVRKKDILALKNDLGPKVILVMVGLPARGKSYLSWCGFNTKVFNVGNRRRVMSSSDNPNDSEEHPAVSERPPSVPSPTPRNPTEAPALSLPASLVPHVTTSSPESPACSPSMSGSYIISPRAPFPSDSPVLHPEAIAAIAKRPSATSPLTVDITPRDGGEEKDELVVKDCKKEGGAFLEVEKEKRVNGPADAKTAENSSGAAAHSPVVVSAPGTSHDASFFDPKNENAKAIRERLAMDTLDEAISWLKHGGGKVAIHDATNSTVERRRAIIDRVAKEKNMQAVFVESICTDDKVLESNIMMKLKGPDYINMPRDEAIRDFKARMSNYEKAYETISEEEEEMEDVSYIKLINVGKKVIANNIHGYIASQCVFYLMQIHIKKRVLWLTRHGESVYNAYNRIGGDPPLTELGHRYACALAKFIQKSHPPVTDFAPSSASSSMPSDMNETSEDGAVKERIWRRVPHSDDFGGGGGTGIPSGGTAIGTDSRNNLAADGCSNAALSQPPPRPLAIWTSTLERTVQSVEGFSPEDYEIKHMRNLNEISAGTCENLTYEEIESHYPQAWAERQANKLLFRYPGAGGESYSDVIERLRPVIVELERMESDVLIVSHQVVMRTLLAYFCGLPLEQMTHLGVPLHTLYRLQPTPYGADLIKYEWNPITDEFDVVGTTL
ncbi:hypothetical protein HDU67_009871 [Dinochytrium kinnereticum]|nr:hypothetical protein HDU67_009871 [Dinochytrium kinnereticum]